MGTITRILSYAFNRGIISPLALARFDLKRLALSAQVCTNWMFRTLGSMMLRPGLAYVDSTYNNGLAVHVPFIFSIPDTAIIELTNYLLRVRVDEAIILRPAVTTAITNPDFTVNLNGWTQADDAGGLSQWVAGPYMSLSGNGTSRGVRYQEVAVAGGNIGIVHALRIIVKKGYVTLRVGTAIGDDSYIEDTTLNPGVHSLALTPTGNFYIQFSSATEYSTLISSCNIEGAGAMTIPTPWPEAMLPNLRWDESADVIFITSDGTLPQMRIERRSPVSWSLVNYYTDDGPFQNGNVDGSIQLSVNALIGDIEITSNIPFFKESMIGQLISLTSTAGAVVTNNVAANNQWSDPIEVTGIGAGRGLDINIGGTWTGTLVLQYSVGAPGAWVDSGQTFTGNEVNYNYVDGFDNQIIYYRLGFETGYGSGIADLQLNFSLPSGNAGIARINGFNSNESVSAQVLTPMGTNVATSQWALGIWSTANGFPTAVCFYQGRLWWFGQDYIMGSVSDAYNSFDQTITGDSGPIIRTIAQGPVSTINWALGLQRLLVGCDGNEQSVHSDALDEPLTPTDFNISSPSTRGSAAVAALKIDINGIFVQRGDPANGNTSGTRLIQIAYQGIYAVIDYTTTDLSEFCPELVEIGILKIAVQRKIDTRIHCLLADGTVAVCVYDPVENEKGFTLINTSGTVIDLFVMPGGVEDLVYYVVERTINGNPVTYLERWALESECAGGAINKNADSHVVIENMAPSVDISVPSLAGETVAVWADGKDVGTDENGNQTITLDGAGDATLEVAATDVVVGLPYTAQFQTTKLTQTIHDGTSLGFARSVDRLGIVLANTHYQGLQYGPDFDHLDPMPLVENGTVTPEDTIWEAYDEDGFEFDGTWSPDSRVCLQAQSPRPCTVLAMNIGVSTSER